MSIHTTREPDPARTALFRLQAECTVGGLVSNELAGKLIAVLAMPHMLATLPDDLERLEDATHRQRVALREVCLTMTGAPITPLEATLRERVVAFVHDLRRLAAQEIVGDFELLGLIARSWPEFEPTPAATPGAH